jgi:UDPglucose 6-dehydrogenase
MRASVIGCGYLGVVHAVALVQLGHEVVGIDVDEERVAQLAARVAPFHEPGLPEALRAALATGRLRFSTEIADAAGATVHFLAVGTPQIAVGGAADLRFVATALDALLPHLAPGDLVVGKSTVPVGTTAGLVERVRATGAELAWNPEFLREGHAIADTLKPTRLVYGLPAGSAGERARAGLDEVYAPIIATGVPVVATDYATAELVKASANAFLAMKISFINAMAEIAEATGADVVQLADALGHDPRIGRAFLNAGVGFGGGCLPKDLRAFVVRAGELGRGEAVEFLAHVDAINLRRRKRVVELVLDELARDPASTRVAVLGLAFKPDSDDVRDSPGLHVVSRLREAGVDVVGIDPVAVTAARRQHPDLRYAERLDDGARDADVIVLVTEWEQFRALTPAALGAVVRGRTLIDGRNVLDPAVWRAAGWRYLGLGRP